MHTFGILFHWIVTLVSRALSRFSLVRLLRWYLMRFQDSLKFDCYVNVSRTFRIPFHPKLSRRHTWRFSTPIAANLIVTDRCEHTSRFFFWPITSALIPGSIGWRLKIAWTNVKKQNGDSEAKKIVSCCHNFATKAPQEAFWKVGL